MPDWKLQKSFVSESQDTHLEMVNLLKHFSLTFLTTFSWFLLG